MASFFIKTNSNEYEIHQELQFFIREKKNTKNNSTQYLLKIEPKKYNLKYLLITYTLNSSLFRTHFGFCLAKIWRPMLFKSTLQECVSGYLCLPQNTSPQRHSNPVSPILLLQVLHLLLFFLPVSVTVIESISKILEFWEGDDPRIRPSISDRVRQSSEHFGHKNLSIAELQLLRQSGGGSMLISLDKLRESFQGRREVSQWLRIWEFFFFFFFCQRYERNYWFLFWGDK